MKFWIGVTDNDWFFRLADQKSEEVNFWSPSGKPLANFLEMGTPFLFKLHAPYSNFVVGGGFFVRFSVLPADLAWEAFGEKNGLPGFDEFVKKIAKYKNKKPSPSLELGCSILTNIFYWPKEQWLELPVHWPASIVRGKTFDDSEEQGAAIWREVTKRLEANTLAIRDEKNLFPSAHQDEATYGKEFPMKPRLGQGAFRIVVTEAYTRKCAITMEKTLPVLQAAHIKPFAKQGPHDVKNGLLLRSDLHTLFDLGYLTITKDLRVEVSSQIKERFSNGREYYRFHGNSLANMPPSEIDKPGAPYLEWHNENVFLG